MLTLVEIPQIPVEVWPLGLIVASAMSFGLYVGYNGFHNMRTDTVRPFLPPI